MRKISSSKIKTVLEISKKNVRSVTGQNLRNIMLLVGKTSIEVKKEDAYKYLPMKETDSWKIDAIVKTKLNHNQVKVGLTTLWVLTHHHVKLCVVVVVVQVC